MVGLDVDLEMIKNVLIVRLNGELDDHTADYVRERVSRMIERNHVKFLIMNFEHVSFMDSSGIGVVLGRYKQIKQRDGKMVLCRVPPTIMRLFSMSGIFKLVEIVETEEEALDKMGGELHEK